MFNQLIAMFAPKYKHLGSSMTLTHRINVIIGIHNLGYPEFWRLIYDDMEMETLSILGDYLQNKDGVKQMKKRYKERPSVKEILSAE